MLNKYHKIDAQKFSQIIGIDQTELPSICVKLLEKNNLKYRVTNGEERDQIILNILDKLENGFFDSSGEERQGKWEKGWDENLTNYSNSNELTELVPKYYRPDNILRIDRDYIVTDNPNMTFEFFEVFRLWVFSHFLKETNEFFEFGCGSGHNLPVVSKLYPRKKIHGLDWVNSSVKIVEKLAQNLEIPLFGHLFDLFEPDFDLAVPDNSSFMTFGCLEQIGDRHGKFLNFVLQKHPNICVNIEPIKEFYETDKLTDFLACQYHTKRNYLDGFLTALEKLKIEGKVEIFDKRRVFFGNIYHEGWSIVSWRPL
jgi:hypothetical protein